jgi:hypothetical protein
VGTRRRRASPTRERSRRGDSRGERSGPEKTQALGAEPSDAFRFDRAEVERFATSRFRGVVTRTVVTEHRAQMEEHVASVDIADLACL